MPSEIGQICRTMAQKVDKMQSPCIQITPTFSSSSEEFARLRIGIDRPSADLAAEAYVLKPFSGEEKKIMPDVVITAMDACQSWLEHSIEQSMNTFNRREVQS